MYLYKVKCPTKRCSRLLGKVTEDMELEIKSMRGHIEVRMLKGSVKCETCGNVFHWDRKLKEN